MTLDQAIQHASEKANDSRCSEDCRADHRQLANWLKELKELKAKKEVKRYSWNDTHSNYDSVLKNSKLKKSGSFSVAFQYVDDNGVRHWKTGWYSNRSNYINDFKDSFHATNE